MEIHPSWRDVVLSRVWSGTAWGSGRLNTFGGGLTRDLWRAFLGYLSPGAGSSPGFVHGLGLTCSVPALFGLELLRLALSVSHSQTPPAPGASLSFFNSISNSLILFLLLPSPPPPCPFPLKSTSLAILSQLVPPAVVSSRFLMKSAA